MDGLIGAAGFLPGRGKMQEPGARSGLRVVVVGGLRSLALATVSTTLAVSLPIRLISGCLVCIFLLIRSLSLRLIFLLACLLVPLFFGRLLGLCSHSCTSLRATLRLIFCTDVLSVFRLVGMGPLVGV